MEEKRSIEPVDRVLENKIGEEVIEAAAEGAERDEVTKILNEAATEAFFRGVPTEEVLTEWQQKERRRRLIKGNVDRSRGNLRRK